VTALPIVEIDLDDPTPPYAQLWRQLVTMIEAAVLKPGERLPPVRQLAGDLGLAPGTVMRAYRELETTGHVRGDRRRGTTVAKRPHRTPFEIDLAVHALAEAYCKSATRAGADPKQIVAAVMNVFAHPGDPGAAGDPYNRGGGAQSAHSAAAWSATRSRSS
jgi:GntR family transcriptional regulator